MTNQSMTRIVNVMCVSDMLLRHNTLAVLIYTQRNSGNPTAGQGYGCPHFAEEIRFRSSDVQVTDVFNLNDLFFIYGGNMAHAVDVMKQAVEQNNPNLNLKKEKTMSQILKKHGVKILRVPSSLLFFVFFLTCILKF